MWYRDATPAAQQAKLTPKWKLALWLGKVDVSDEHLVCEAGVNLHKVRTIRWLPDSSGEQCRWDQKAILGMKALPWSVNFRVASTAE